MARTTLAGTKAELFDVLTADTVTGKPVAALAAEGVALVYDHEPFPQDMALPVSVTVATDRILPTDWGFAVRVYCFVTVSAKESQAQLDRVMPAVDDLLDNFGSSDWRVRLHEWKTPANAAIAAFVGTNLLEVGREDF